MDEVLGADDTGVAEVDGRALLIGRADTDEVGAAEDDGAADEEDGAALLTGRAGADEEDGADEDGAADEEGAAEDGAADDAAGEEDEGAEEAGEDDDDCAMGLAVAEADELVKGHTYTSDVAVTVMVVSGCVYVPGPKVAGVG